MNDSFTITLETILFNRKAEMKFFQENGSVDVVKYNFCLQKDQFLTR